MIIEFFAKFNSIDDAVNLVNRLEHYNCRADAWLDSRVIDARSLMGLLDLGIGNMIRIVVHSQFDDDVRESLLGYGEKLFPTATPHR